MNSQINNEQYVPHQPQYTQQAKVEEPVSLKEWLITLLILIIPLVNIIMCFVWAFGDGKESKKNFFKAYLIFTAIMLVLSIIFSATIGAILISLLSETL